MYSFQRYLAAKETVDHRALNRHVWHTLIAALPERRPLRVLEVGAGIGTMLRRMAGWGIPYAQVEYTGVDAEEANIKAAEAAAKNGRQRLFRPRFVTADAFEFIQNEAASSYDVLIAHAFLDLLDVPAALPLLFSALVPDGVYYFSINFDGLTIFEPVADEDFEAHLMHLYHRSMDERITKGTRSGDSRSGRHLYHQLRGAGASVLAAGASDWVVIPNEDGTYPADEAYFLRHILHFFETTLTDHAELDQTRFKAWLSERHNQIDTGDLIYVAHQLDYVGRIS